MSRGAWRVILTDSESLTGVAPVCPATATNHLIEDDDGAPLPGVHEAGVYDCCPDPHIECYDERLAQQVAEILSKAGAELCS